MLLHHYYLFIPLILFVAVLVASLIVLRNFQSQITEFLLAKKRTKIAVNFFIPLLACFSSVLFGLSDKKAIQDLKPSLGTILILSLFAITAAGSILFTLLSSLIDSKNDKSIEKAIEDRDRYKSAAEDAKKEAAIQKENADFIKAVNDLFLNVVVAKSTRLEKHKAELLRTDKSHEVFHKVMHSAVNPDKQFSRIFATVYELLKLQLWDCGEKNAKLRLAVFEVQDNGSLKLTFSWDGKKANQIRGNNRRNSKERFKIGQSITEKCLAVHAAETGSIQIIEDAEEANADPLSAYWHLHEGHWEKLKSMVAIPLGIPSSTDMPTPWVLCADTDRKHVFSQEYMPRFEVIRSNTEERYAYETSVKRAYKSLDSTT